MYIIPLTLLDLDDNGFHLLMEVIVFGKPFLAVLDTGASKTVFDKSMVEQYQDEESKLHATDLLSTGLGTNTMKSYMMRFPEIQLGELHLKNKEIAVLDLSSINFAYTEMKFEPIIGVIGGDILRTYGGVINYRKLTLQLGKRKMNKAKLSPQ